MGELVGRGLLREGCRGDETVGGDNACPESVEESADTEFAKMHSALGTLLSDLHPTHVCLSSPSLHLLRVALNNC